MRAEEGEEEAEGRERRRAAAVVLGERQADRDEKRNKRLEIIEGTRIVSWGEMGSAARAEVCCHVK